MRKTLSLLLVVAMVFGIVGTAFAATFPDVTNTTQAAAIDELNALGVMTGDNGQFRPNDPITRAEFAAVVVRMLGLESAAKLINTPPSFKDVTANSAWAYGYINIASTKNIVKGDPGGTFRPTANVTFAEAVTMLVRAAGWDAECSKMAWPAGYIMKATEYGLTDDVVFDANKPATRGDVALMADAGLSMKVAAYDSDTQTWSESAQTMLQKYLKSSYATVIVTATPATNANLKANQLVTSDGTMYVPAGVDPNAFLGREVSVIKKSSTTYSYIQDATDASQIVVANANADYVKDATTIAVYDGDNVVTTYNMVGAIPTTKVVRNNVVQSNVNQAIMTDDDVTLFLDDNANVRFIVAEAYAAKEGIISAKTTKGVDGATTNTFTVRNNTVTVPSGDIQWTVLANTVITKDGKPATFADIAKGQVVYVKGAGTNAYSVEVYTTKVTGIVSAINFSSSGKAILTVGGTNYTVSNATYAADCTIDGGTSQPATAMGQLIGYTVELTLNQAGQARIVKATSTANIGRLTAAVAAGDVKFTASIKGVSTSFTATSTAIGGAIAANTLVEIKATADGVVYSVTNVTGSVAEYTVVAVDTTNKLLTVKATAGGLISVIAYSSNMFGVRNGTWGDVTALQKDDVLSLYVAAGTVKYFETSSSGVVGGKYVGQATVGTTVTLYFQVQNAVKSYTTSMSGAAITAASLDVNDFCEITVDPTGVVTAIDNRGARADIVVAGGDKYADAFDAVNATDITIDSITGNYVVAHYSDSATTTKSVVLKLSSASIFTWDVVNGLVGTTVSGLRVGDVMNIVTDNAGHNGTGAILIVYVAR